MLRSICWGLAISASVFVVGCGGGQKRLPTIAVEGALTVDGKPYGPGTVSLSPPEGPDAKIPTASGVVGADGKFTLDSYGPKSGVVPGTYTVNLAGDPMTMVMPLSTKPLQVTINKEDKSVKIDLVTMKGAKPGAVPPANTGAGTDLIIGR